MATGVSGSNYGTPSTPEASIGAVPAEGIKSGGRIAVTWYVMRAVDANAATTPPTYRHWKVRDRPDYTGAQYVGPYSGGSLNLTTITIQDVLEVNE